MPDNNDLRVPQLDGLRCFAVLAVIWFHWATPTYQGNFLKTSLGEIGVTLFFVLSGFLITKILLSTRTKCHSFSDTVRAIKTFWIRRALRIFPLYYGTLAILVLFDIPPHREAIGWHLLYLQNIYQRLTSYQIWGSHLWTLAIEEQFYVLWPFLIFFLNKRYLLFFFAMMISIALVYRTTWSFFPNYLVSPSRLLIDHLDCFGAGALFSYLSTTYEAKKVAFLAKLFFIAGTSLFILSQPTFFSSRVLVPTSLSLISVAIVYLTYDGVNGALGHLLKNRLVVYTGTLSYGLYVFHSLVPAFWLWFYWKCPIPGYRLFHRLGLSVAIIDNYWFQIPLFFFMTVFLSMISWHLFEKPINSLKKRFSY